MLPTMSEEMPATEPTIIFRQNQVSFPIVPSKSRLYRKYVFAAVIGVVTVAIILTAILVGMYLFTEAQKDILKFSYNRDSNTKEEVISNPNTNIVQFHATDPDYELWVVNDFNRVSDSVQEPQSYKDIQVMKVRAKHATNCYLAPLDRTISTNPSSVSAPSDITKKRNESNAMSYRASNTPILDISFLSKEAKDACDGISTYWVFPRCETPNSSVSREKRQDGGTGGFSSDIVIIHGCVVSYCCGWYYYLEAYVCVCWCSS